MKTMILAAAAALSLGIGSAQAAAGSGGDNPITFSTQLPGVVAQTPAQSAPAAATTLQPGHSPWLFPPIGKYLDQDAS